MSSRLTCRGSLRGHALHEEAVLGELRVVERFVLIHRAGAVEDHDRPCRRRLAQRGRKRIEIADGAAEDLPVDDASAEPRSFTTHVRAFDSSSFVGDDGGDDTGIEFGDEGGDDVSDDCSELRSLPVPLVGADSE